MVRVILVLNYTWAFSDIRIQPENDGRRLGGRTFEFRSARASDLEVRLQSGLQGLPVGLFIEVAANSESESGERARMRPACDIPCRTFRALDASGCVTIPPMGQREVQMQAPDGGRAAWRAGMMQNSIFM